MTRDDAWNIVQEFVKNPNLQKHMLAVEAAMAAYAKHYQAPDLNWRLAGLLHDFDWEIHPTLEGHPQKGVEILKSRGVPDEIIRAILSHANHTGVKRESIMEKVLYACDELTGLIVAVALVRPSKKLADVDVKAIQKKFKEKSFAAGVNRAEVIDGSAALGVGLWTEHVPLVLNAMQSAATSLGL
jgi:putative nucleotidyltransferase with HDIG domain